MPRAGIVQMCRSIIFSDTTFAANAMTIISEGTLCTYIFMDLIASKFTLHRFSNCISPTRWALIVLIVIHCQISHE